jgi:proline iminopeptidase
MTLNPPTSFKPKQVSPPDAAQGRSAFKLCDPLDGLEAHCLESFYFKVDATHTLYVETWGNPKGVPFVFLHGGPGAGFAAKHRRLFDPVKHWVCFVDQRGAGWSLPHASLEANTTWHLVADLEALRQHLQIERWGILGGSWGSTLALAYAQSHPKSVLGLILRGIFLCRPEEIEWFYQQGCHWMSPELWESYVEWIPKEERHELLQAYYRRLTYPDPSVQQAAAQRWAAWEEFNCSIQEQDRTNPTAAYLTQPDVALSLARIEAHYFINHCFFTPETALLGNTACLSQIPTYIIHGQYDLICPPKNAWDLAKAMPHAHLSRVPMAGHAFSDPGVFEAQQNALEELTQQLRMP